MAFEPENNQKASGIGAQDHDPVAVPENLFSSNSPEAQGIIRELKEGGQGQSFIDQSTSTGNSSAADKKKKEKERDDMAMGLALDAQISALRDDLERANKELNEANEAYAESESLYDNSALGYAKKFQALHEHENTLTHDHHAIMVDININGIDVKTLAFKDGDHYSYLTPEGFETQRGLTEDQINQIETQMHEGGVWGDDIPQGIRDDFHNSLNHAATSAHHLSGHLDTFQESHSHVEGKTMARDKIQTKLDQTLEEQAALEEQTEFNEHDAAHHEAFQNFKDNLIGEFKSAATGETSPMAPPALTYNAQQAALEAEIINQIEAGAISSVALDELLANTSPEMRANVLGKLDERGIEIQEPQIGAPQIFGGAGIIAQINEGPSAGVPILDGPTALSAARQYDDAINDPSFMNNSFGQAAMQPLEPRPDMLQPSQGFTPNSEFNNELNNELSA